MRALVVVAIAGCASSPPPPPSNQMPTGPLTTVTGRITDESNAPLEGVTVIVNPAGRWADTEGRPPEGEKPLADSITDAKGVYEIDKLAPGRYDVRFYYVDIVAHRVVDVRGPSTVDQQINGGWMSSGVQRHCADASAASCK